MLIEIEFNAYNPRRYGRPWGARITFNGPKPEYDFTGHWDGTTLVIEADAGDVICCGQKDHRGKHSTKQFCIVDADGTLTDVSESKARKHFLAAVTPAAVQTGT